MTGSFKGGKTDGLVTSWHEHGQKRFEVNFKDGRFHGLNLLWHENGQKEQEIYYKEGKKDGPSSQISSKIFNLAKDIDKF